MNEILKKALVSENTLRGFNIVELGDDKSVRAELDNIKSALNQAEENENFLKIIFANFYWARWFKWIKECKTCEEYNNIFVENAPTRLTQAEFDLVKKVVEKYGK